MPDPNVPDAFVVTANRHSNSLYTSNAQLVVYRLVGDFDPKEAITHGYIDSQQLPAWRNTNASLADFNGSPSSIIEGTYRRKPDDAQHLAPPRHRHLRTGQIPGVAGGDDGCRVGLSPRRRPPTGSSTGSGRARPGLTHPQPRRPQPPAAPAAPPAASLRHRRWRTSTRARAQRGPAGLVLWPHADRGSAVRVRGGDDGRARTAVAGASRRHRHGRAGDAFRRAAATGRRNHAGGRGNVAMAAPAAPPCRSSACASWGLGTVAAGSWQTARYALRHEEASVSCGGSCAACTLACH